MEGTKRKNTKLVRDEFKDSLGLVCNEARMLYVMLQRVGCGESLYSISRMSVNQSL